MLSTLKVRHEQLVAEYERASLLVHQVAAMTRPSVFTHVYTITAYPDKKTSEAELEINSFIKLFV